MVTFASSTLAVVLVATLAIVVTPRRSSNPTAIGATTVPSLGARSLGIDGSTVASSFQSAGIASFTAIPSAIAAVPSAADPSDVGDPDLAATELPDLDDDVVVLTDEHAYVVRWRDVAAMSQTDDAIVLAEDGSIIAVIKLGHLVVAPDTKVGATVGATVGAEVGATVGATVGADD